MLGTVTVVEMALLPIIAVSAPLIVAAVLHVSATLFGVGVGALLAATAAYVDQFTSVKPSRSISATWEAS